MYTGIVCAFLRNSGNHLSNFGLYQYWYTRQFVYETMKIRCVFFLIHINEVVGRSPKCVRKNSAKRIQKNLRNIYWYIQLLYTFLVFFMILVSCPEWPRSCFATQYKIFSNIYSATCAKRGATSNFI